MLKQNRLVLWFVWFVWFISLNRTNQMNKTNHMNRINPSRQSRLAIPQGSVRRATCATQVSAVGLTT